MLIPGNIYIFRSIAYEIPLYTFVDAENSFHSLKPGFVFILLELVTSRYQHMRKILVNNQVGYAIIYDYECELLCTKD